MANYSVPNFFLIWAFSRFPPHFWVTAYENGFANNSYIAYIGSSYRKNAKRTPNIMSVHVFCNAIQIGFGLFSVSDYLLQNCCKTPARQGDFCPLSRIYANIPSNKFFDSVSEALNRFFKTVFWWAIGKVLTMRLYESMRFHVNVGRIAKRRNAVSRNP